MKPKAEWERDKVWVIGSSYCHSRQFKVDQSTFEVFKMFNKVIGKVATQHAQLFQHVEETDFRRQDSGWNDPRCANRCSVHPL